MTDVELLLDTNAAIAISRRNADAVSAVLQYRCAALSLYTLGELQFGILKSSPKEEAIASLENLRRRFFVLQPDEETAEHCAFARFQFRRSGHPIPVNDLWIAATALRHGIPLMTKDAHFEGLPQLTVVRW